MSKIFNLGIFSATCTNVGNFMCLKVDKYFAKFHETGVNRWRGQLAIDWKCAKYSELVVLRTIAIDLHQPRKIWRNIYRLREAKTSHLEDWVGKENI